MFYLVQFIVLKTDKSIQFMTLKLKIQFIQRILYLLLITSFIRTENVL
jgi:hypothetical protein